MFVRMVGGPEDGREYQIAQNTHVYVAECQPITAAFVADDPTLDFTPMSTWRVPITPCLDINTGSWYNVAMWDEKEA